MLQRIQKAYTDIQAKGKHLVLYEYIEAHICDHSKLWKDRLQLEEETFDGLVDSGILTKEISTLHIFISQ